MYLFALVIAGPLHRVEHHAAIVVELGQLVAVQNQTIFTIANHAHIGLEYLRGKVLCKNQIDVPIQPVLFGFLNQFHLLVECAKHDHAG